MLFNTYLDSLKGLEHRSDWGLQKLEELHVVFKTDPAMLEPGEETLTRTEFFVKQRELRTAILSSCHTCCYQDSYDRNEEDLIWVHGRFINGKLFTAISRIILCCGGRITYQY